MKEYFNSYDFARLTARESLPSTKMDLKFEKLMRLTESENDHEALSALRIAQALCKKSGYKFTDFLLSGSSYKNNNGAEIYDLKRKIAIYSLELSQLGFWAL